MPTKVFFGSGCVLSGAGELCALGKKAVIVAGKSSGEKSGALGDILLALKSGGIGYCIYNEVLNNPTLENCFGGGIFAKENKADFVIGVGGGSPLDAAKAVAVYAANDIRPEDIFEGGFKNLPLPIVAVPTTAGTGSEVTPYSIITLNDEQTKRSFQSEHIFPRLAFLDAGYTASLPAAVCIDTVLDALSHAVESLLTRRRSAAADYIALRALSIIAGELAGTKTAPLPPGPREKLLYASMLAGIAIAHTGTAIVHAAGYSLTYFKGIAHGRANALLLPGFLDKAMLYEPERTGEVLAAMGMRDVGELRALIKSLLCAEYPLTGDEIKKFSMMALGAKSAAVNPWPVTLESLNELYLSAGKVGA